MAIAENKPQAAPGQGNYFKGYYADSSALSTAYPAGQNGWYAVVGSTDSFWVWDADTNAWVDTDQTAMGDVVGPASATDTAIALFNTTTGKLIKNSGWLISSTDVMSSVTSTAAIGIGIASATSKIDILSLALGATPDVSKGISLRNTTAAANGAQQGSPSIMWEGQGWKTAATAASQSVKYQVFVTPVQGTSAATGEWHLQVSNNGAAYEDRLVVGPSGIAVSSQSGFSSTVQIGTNYSITNYGAIGLFTAPGTTILGGHSFALAQPFNATTGTQKFISSAANFTPSGAGNANYRNIDISYTLTGTAGAQTGNATGIFLNATEATLNGLTHNLIDLQNAGASQFKVNSTGTLTTFNIILSAGFVNGANYSMSWNGRSIMSSPGDGIMRSTNWGGSMNATIYQNAPISVKATTPVTVSALDCSSVYTNEGASAKIVFNLPTAVAGYKYTWVVQDADGIDITAASGDTIRFGSTVTAAAGTITSTTIGSTITLVAINATEWVATSLMGTWA